MIVCFRQKLMSDMERLALLHVILYTFEQIFKTDLAMSRNMMMYAFFEKLEPLHLQYLLLPIKCQWPSISGQEWIFTLPGPPPPPQMNKIYKTMVILKTLSIRKWRTVIPGRQEANRVSPLTFQAHCLERVSRP